MEGRLSERGTVKKKQPTTAPMDVHYVMRQEEKWSDGAMEAHSPVRILEVDIHFLCGTEEL